jgi:hypothetical protein
MISAQSGLAISRLGLLMNLAFNLHWNAKTMQPVGCLDLVTIAPIALFILHVIVEDELVDRRNQLEIVFPWNMI